MALGNRLSSVVSKELELFLFTLDQTAFTFLPSHINDCTTRFSPFFYTMGLLGAFTLVRLTLLLLTMVGLSSPLPAPYSQVSTAVHRITDAVIRDVVVDETSGTVVDSKDQRRIDQGSASDGAGSGFNVPAVLWISFGLAVGLYLTVGGMRLWRMTTAFALGIVSAFCGMSSLSEGSWSSA